jgi:two-component system sensor kinase FixL
MHGRVPLPAATTSRPRRRKEFGLRMHLGVLVAAALIPALGLGGLVFWDAASAYHRASEGRLLGHARALALAIARDLDMQRSLVTALIDLPEVRDPAADLGEFDAIARRLAQPVDGWVVLTDPVARRQLVNTRFEAGTPLPPSWGPGPLRDQVTGSPGVTVLNLVESPLLPHPILGVTATVRVDGEVARILGLYTTPRRLVPIVQQVPLAAGGFVTLVDGNRRVVARSHDHDRWVGQPVPPAVPEDRSLGRVARVRNLEGIEVLVSTQPVPDAPGWFIAVAEPWQRFATLRNESFVKPLVGAIASFVLGIVLVLWFAGRIVRPVEAVARHLERDAGSSSIPPSGIVELDKLAEQITTARAELQGRAAEAERQAALIASVMDAATEPVFAKDLDLRFVIANRAATEVMGGSMGALLGKRVTEVADPRVAPISEAHDRRVLATGQPWTGEQNVMTEVGQRVFMTTKVPWRNSTGQVIGIVAVARDITHARAVEQRLAAAQTRLLQVSRLGATGMMAAGLAHEINQPLTAVANYAGVATRGLGEPGTPPPGHERIEEVRRVLPNITAQARRAAAILSRLRGFISEGASDLRPEPVEEVLRDACAIAAATLAREEAELLLDFSTPLGWAELDRVQLQQALFNLLRNAAEAMRGCPTRRIRLSARRREPDAKGALEIEVADSGPGLPADVSSHLFEPFVTTKPDGLGVGLAICRRAIEAQGGTLSAGRAPEGGALFRIVLPDHSAPP